MCKIVGACFGQVLGVMARAEGIETRWSVGNIIALRCIWYEIMYIYLGSSCIEYTWLVIYSMVVGKEETRKGIPGGTCQDAACLTEYAISLYRSVEEVMCRQDL